MVKRRSMTLLAVGAALVLSASTVAPAQGQAEQGIRISLAEVLRLALDNNLDLVSARKDPAISGERVEVQKAAFDGGFNTSFFGNGFETEPSDEFTSSGIGNTYGVRGQYTELFGFGGDIDLTLITTRRKGAGSIFFIPRDRDVIEVPDPADIDPSDGIDTITIAGDGLDDPFYQSQLNLTFNVPLLRGRGKEATKEQLLLAEGNLEISRNELRRQAELTLETVEGAYWDVLAAIRDLDVKKQALKRAEDLLELNRKKVEVGTLAPIEITQAEAGVASQEEGVILAREGLENAEDELRRLLAIPWGDPMWGMHIIPTDTPVFQALEIDLDQSIEEALGSRPELVNARRELRNKQLSERVARNRAKHGLDLALTFSPEGNSNNIEDFVFDDPTLPPSEQLGPGAGNAGDTYDELIESDFFTWQGSLTYSIPIGNRQAKADFRIATLDREKSEVDLQNQTQSIKVEVRRAVRSIDSGIQRVQAARTNVRLQTEKLEAEQKKFENGMSTSFEVLTFQNDLADAELSLIRAALDYTKALAGLERSKGTLLQARGFSLGDAQ